MNNQAEENQAQGEQQGGDNSHISYVKHLSSDQDMPGNDDQQDGGFISKVPGGWWTIGIGAATVVIGILTLHKMGQSNGTAPSGSEAYYPYHPNTSAGSSQDTGGTVPGAMDNQLTGLLGQEQINNQILQAILANLTGKTNPGGTPKPTPDPVDPPPHWRHGPPPVKLPAVSNHWIYTTKRGDTLNSLNKFAHWGSLNSLNQSGNNVYKYLGNDKIFSKEKITGVNQQIPVGTHILL